MNVVFALEAEDDLERIADFIAVDNPVRAESFVNELIERCELLADNPRAFPLVPRYEQAGVRRRPHGNYLIFYRVGPDWIEILHVLHGAQDYAAVLLPDHILPRRDHRP